MAFVLGPIKIPEPESVCCDRENAGTVQDAFVLGGEPPSRITKHPHGHDGREGLGRVIPNVFLKGQVSVKVEAQVAPILLRPERRFTGIGVEPQILLE